MIDMFFFGSLALNSLPINTVISAVDRRMTGADTMAQARPNQTEEPVITETDGFQFRYVGCEATRNPERPYRCNFLVQNELSISRDLTVFGSWTGGSYIVDDEGINIKAAAAEVGGNRQTYAGTGPTQPGVPTRVSIFLEDAPTNYVRFIDLICGTSKGEGFTSMRPL